MGVFAAVTATFFDTASRSAINPFNFFGFFTMQSNILLAALLLITAAQELTRRSRRPSWIVPARAAATTYMLIVGIVYNTLLDGLAGGVDLGWANAVLHIVFPLYALADWILFNDRYQLPMQLVWLMLIYPLTWCAVVLIRGATDGWVPYPFLDPATGYVSVTTYVVAIATTIAVFGMFVIWISRFHRPLRRPQRTTRDGTSDRGHL
ncbi:Pr6Pr family membrane protein [Nesterenkonia halotolerans]|uniref:Pr6Pr family membrane protein n=1 Tax=Nesterenkonia halotolerans TaxID=225325 RepID=A0ABR9J633_9MICC|nr:Pr6Pr family membrane protein [Nesterenkonia halotolerans]MBE1514445.1 hypothetical protein [Nesterenkonia halotolerans]